MSAHPPANRRTVIGFAAAIVFVGALASGGGLTGRATGGQGCGAPPPVLSEVDTGVLVADADCDPEAILAHGDSLAVLQDHVFTPACSGCHKPGALAGNVDLSSAEASRASMVGVPAQNTVAAKNGWQLVRPGDAERSFVYRKVSSPGVGEGAPMPPGDHALTETYRTALAAWIDAGAPPASGGPLADLAACEVLEERLDAPMAFADPWGDCAECHPQHVAEWSISNHAYAAKDPVFHAMVRLGQHQTNGKLDQFCVQCHSPIGMATGQTEVTYDEASERFVQDVEGLDALAQTGVSCDVCHSISAVMEPHNARMVLSPNGVRRGTIADPVKTEAHASAYSDLHGSSDVCSSCHAVTNPKGALVEETFAEWTVSPAADAGRTCQGCHMPSYTGAAAPDGPERELHRHTFVGVDVSLLPPEEFPGYDELRARTAELLRSSAELRLRADEATKEIVVEVENLAGHALPSGATAERQLWIELIVRDGDEDIVLESGTLDADGNLRDAFPGHSTAPGSDPQLTVFTQYMLSDAVLATLTEAEDKSARRLELTDSCEQIVRGTIPEGVSVVPFPWSAHWQCNTMIPPGETAERRYRLPDAAGRAGLVARVRLRFRAFPPYFLTKLEDSAQLDPAVASRLPLVTLAEAELALPDGFAEAAGPDTGD